MTPVEILRKAKERIAQPGVWVSYAPYDENCECAVTACANVSGRGSEWDTAATFLDVAATKWGFASNDTYIRPAAQFNDAPERTLEEVLALFDQAILLAESAP